MSLINGLIKQQDVATRTYICKISKQFPLNPIIFKILTQHAYRGNGKLQRNILQQNHCTYLRDFICLVTSNFISKALDGGTSMVELCFLASKTCEIHVNASIKLMSKFWGDFF